MNTNLLKSVFKYSGILLASVGTGFIIGKQEKLLKKVKNNIFSRDNSTDKSRKNKNYDIPEFIKSNKGLILETLIKFCENFEPKLEVVRNFIPEMNENDGSKAKCFFDPETLIPYKIVINKTNSINEEVRLLIHEIAHAILHSGNDRLRAEDGLSSRELEAELTTFLVLDELGMKLSDSDLSYLNGYFDKVGEAVLTFEKSRDRIYSAFEKIIEGIIKFAERPETEQNNEASTYKSKSFLELELQRKLISDIDEKGIVKLKKLIILFKKEKPIELLILVNQFIEKNYKNPFVETLIINIHSYCLELSTRSEVEEITLTENFSILDAFQLILALPPRKSGLIKSNINNEKYSYDSGTYEFFSEYLEDSVWWHYECIGVYYYAKIDSSSVRELASKYKIHTRITDRWNNVYEVFDPNGKPVDIVKYKLGETGIAL